MASLELEQLSLRLLPEKPPPSLEELRRALADREQELASHIKRISGGVGGTFIYGRLHLKVNTSSDFSLFTALGDGSEIFGLTYRNLTAETPTEPQYEMSLRANGRIKIYDLKSMQEKDFEAVLENVSSIQSKLAEFPSRRI